MIKSMDEKRVADYFVVSGLLDNPDPSSETRNFINPALPITDITVIFKGLGEECPIGYTCIEHTPGGHNADLNNGNFKSSDIHICYTRGYDKPPLVDVGVLHEDRDRVLPDVEVVYKTPCGRPASTGNSGHKSGTYITYRRAKTNRPFNQNVVVDLCVILNSKEEHPPRAFYTIKKNLNKSYYGMIGSEVFLCYKKTILSPPLISYTPQIISRFPLQDYPNFQLPNTVPLFCLPTGANVELWPADLPPRPMLSPTTFVLTTDSAQKMYGSAVSFYELFDETSLSEDQKFRFGLTDQAKNDDNYHLYTTKSICIISRWPFFDCFEKFLAFLHKLVFDPKYNSSAPQVSLEHHISHFLLDVVFPTPDRPRVLVQLMPGTDDEVSISQPSRRPLPPTGASFSQLLSILGVDNTMNVLLFGLSEQKILLHSLKPLRLTGVAEAVSAMLFPFHWQCPYVPLCPLSLYGILNAPLPFIVGIDSRCFDAFTPPADIICIDLDTKSIFLSEHKRCLNLRILPKRAARVLRSSLEKIFPRLERLYDSNHSPQHRLTMAESSRLQLEKKLDLEIQEAFLRFMATILRGFRSYLLPITKAPTVGATDPTSLFDFEGFLSSRDRNYSQFYQLITKTQMFTHYIEERSFVSDKDTSLAFFDDCEEKLSSSDEIYSDRPIKLFETNESQIQADRSVYIPAPEQSPSFSSSDIMSSEKTSDVKRRFGPLNPTLFHRHPPISSHHSSKKAHKGSDATSTQLAFEDLSFETNSSFSISRRTKQEIKASQKLAKKCSEFPLEWSKYLVSCCYCLWFSVLPSYIIYCKSKSASRSDLTSSQVESTSKSTLRILRYAFFTIVRMQKLQLRTDEICFRVLTLLCGHYEQPALAVRVFFEMKKAGIKPNAVTYGYYNKAVLESKWPDHSSKPPTTVLWTKIRNVITGIALFKSHGKIMRQRRNMLCMPLIADASFYTPGDLTERATQCAIAGEYFDQTIMPISRHYEDHDKGPYETRNSHHRRSLVNRSFSTYPKCSGDFDETANESSFAPNNLKRTALIHKSYSMHLRNGSPERTSLLQKTQSSSLEDEEGAKSNRPVDASLRRTATAPESSCNLKQRYQLLKDPDSDRLIADNLTYIEHPAGLLFTNSLDAARQLSPAPLIESSSQEKSSIDKRTELAANKPPYGGVGQPSPSLLLGSCLTSQANVVNVANQILNTDKFGEDAKILRKIENCEQQPQEQGSVDPHTGDGTPASRDIRGNQSSELTSDQNDKNPDLEEDFGLLNKKLQSIINDAASPLQWKWTSSQNPKSVYKGIKSAATGLVSSFQEMKSSFSISNNNTPAKLLNSAHHRSNATREMISQWAANYFKSQSDRVGDDSDDSISSNDLLRLSNEEDVDSSGAEANDFRFCHSLFDNLEKHYGNFASIEDLVNHSSDTGDGLDQTKLAVEVKMTTCSKCNVCRSLLYDEEIMERWSHNESNLNTKCVYCRAKIVPLMCITIEDHRFDNSNRDVEENRQEPLICLGGSEEVNNLVDLNPEEHENESHDKSQSGSRRRTSNDLKSRQISNSPVNSVQELTVPYLSPIVLRKELESVFESSGGKCLASSQFVDEHPIIYWNLLWYFSRINIPTHLAMLCLDSKCLLSGRDIPTSASHRDLVVVKTLWDNDKLQASVGKPLYRLYERGDPSIEVQSILSDQLHFTYSSLERVINLIRTNELQKAMTLVLNARLKNSSKFSFDKNRHNLYRDLVFLIKMALGPGKFYMDHFEREYKKAFENLNFQQVALNRFDRPPSIGSIFCRKSFRELSLERCS